MYEGDTPNAERRAAALALDRDLLRELLGQEELRELIDPEALEEVEAQLQHRTEAGRAGDRDALQQVLRNLGDLTADECARAGRRGLLGRLDAREARRRAPRRRGPDRRRGALHRRRGRRPLPRRARRAAARRPARVLPRGRPTTPMRAAGPPLRPHPRPLPDRAAGRAATASTRSPALRELERDGALVRGELLPGGTEREWCDADVLRRVRRASLAHLRREVEAADRASCARFLPSWQNVDAHRPAGAGPDRLREALVPLQGVALTPKVWERDVLPRRLGAYSPEPGSTSSAPAARWSGSAPAPLGRSDGRVALYFREDVRLAGPPPANAKLERAEGEVHDAIRERLAAGPELLARPRRRARPPRRGAARGALGPRLGGRGDQRRLRAAARAAPARRAARRARAAAASPAAAAAPAQAVQGRWSLTAPLFEDAPAAGPRLRAQAELMLERYGIVTRETVLAEGVPGGFSTLYGELGNLEMLGTARRGYFVEGLGGAQFALAGRGRAAALAAATPDGSYHAPRRHRPRQPLRRRAALAEAARAARRPGRAPGAYVLLRDGEPRALRRAGDDAVTLQHQLRLGA